MPGITSQITDRKQDGMVNIRVGKFRFTLDKDSRDQIKKSPSQIKRDLDRQIQFKRRF